jgi:hypothetical protein
MTSLAAQAAASKTSPATATFTGKASIPDITDPLAPVSIDGGATLQLSMTDQGEPGSKDTIAIAVWLKTGARIRKRLERDEDRRAAPRGRQPRRALIGGARQS